MKKYILSIDSGTTGITILIFNRKLSILQRYNTVYTNTEKKHEQKFKKFKTSF